MSQMPEPDETRDMAERPEAPQPPAARKRGGAWRVLRNLLLALLLCVVVVGAGLAARLATGPIQMTWAVPYLENMLDAQGGMAGAIDVDDLSLAWNAQAGRIEFTADKISVTDKNQTLSAVDRVGVTLSVRALLVGQLAVKDITLIAPHLRLDLQKQEAQAGAAPLALFAGEGNNPLSRLNSIFIQRGVVELQTAPGEARHILSGLQLDWQRRRSETHAVMTATLQLAEDPAPRPVHVTLQEAKGHINLSLNVREVSPDNIQGILEALSPGLLSPSLSLQRLQMPVSLALNIGLTSAGALRNIGGTLTAGTGHVIVPELYDSAIPVDRFSVTGNYDATSGLWEISDLQAALLDEDAPIPVTLTASNADKKLKFHLTMGNVNVSALKRWWPPTAAPGGYVWVRDFVHEGNLANSDIAAVLAKDAADKWDIENINGKWEVQGIGVTFLPAFGPVTDVNGTATMDADNIHFDLNYGRLHGLELQNAQMKIDGLRADMQNLYLDLPAVGQLQHALELIDTPPYRYSSQYGLDYKTARGGIGLFMHFEFPLLAALKMEEIQYSVEANLRDVSLQKLLMDKDITNGEGTFELTPAAMKVRGKAALAGVPGTFEWHDFIAPKDNLTRSVNFTADMTDDDLAKFGLPVAGYVKGKSSASGNYETRGGNNTLRVKLDMTPAAVAMRELNYTKAAGTPMTVNATLGMGGASSGLAITATAQGLALDGTGKLDATMKPAALDFGIFRVGDKTNAQIKLTTSGAAERWMISGQSFDASGLLADNGEKKKEDKTPRWVGLQLETLYLAQQAEMKNVKLEANYNGAAYDKLLLSGKMQGKTPITVTYEPRGRGQYINAATDDAGLALQMLGVTDNIRGGRLRVVSNNFNDPGFPLAGQITLRDFRVVGAPFMAKLLALTSPGGLLDALNGEGIAFSRLDTGFRYNDNVLRFENGKTNGSAVGLTFNGDIVHIDNPDKLYLSGTIVPLYAVNTALSGIPLIGEILGGKSGLLGFNYSATGPVSDPDVSINPLSALTPGFLRDLLFENKPEQADQQTSRPADQNSQSVQ